MSAVRFTWLILVIWSSQAFAQPKIESTGPVETSALKISPSYRYIVPASLVQIGNMPRVYSQASVASCFGCSAAAIVQKYICDHDRNIKKLGLRCDDPHFPSDLIVSPLGMVAWADTNADRRTAPLYMEPGFPSNHTNLKLYRDRTHYSSGADSLLNSADAFQFIPESCFPTKRLIEIYGDDGKIDKSTGRMVDFNQAYEKARGFYDHYRNKHIYDNKLCKSCLSKLNTDLGTSFDPAAVAEALTRDTYPEFLYALFFAKCESVSFDNTATYKQLPARGQTFPRSELYQAIVSVIDRKTPVQVNSLCIIKNTNTVTGRAAKDNCLSYHTLVVDGYRTACQNSDAAKCVRQLHVHNCWGDYWQRENNDGWLDAEPFVEHIAYGEDIIRAGELSWLE